MSKLKRWVRPRQLIWMLLIPAFWWILRSVPAADIWSILSHLTLGQVLALAGMNITILLIFTSRWWLVLRTLGYQLPFPVLVGYRLAGFGLSYFTPGPQIGGEALQVHLTQSRHVIPTAAAVAAVTLDKPLNGHRIGLPGSPSVVSARSGRNPDRSSGSRPVAHVFLLPHQAGIHSARKV